MDGLLLVGHGSRSPHSEKEMRAIVDLVARAMPDVAVDVGFLELTDPPAGSVLDALVDRGCRRIVVLPLMLLAAGHGKNDVPAVVLDARLRHLDVDVMFGSPLGVVRDLVGILGERVDGAGGGGLPLLVVARGTSDPDANAEAYRATRLVAEWTGAPFTQTAFTGVTWPTVPQGLDVFASVSGRPVDGGAGPGPVGRLALVFWFLCNGLLIERARAQAVEFTLRTGIEVVDAGYIGPDVRLVPLIRQRYADALAGAAPVYTCDTCVYRAPFPGLEDRVGQPLGHGHSHLAAEHRAR